MNNTKQYYRVADHLFVLEADSQQLAQLRHFEPFIAEPAEQDVVFSLAIRIRALPSVDGWEAVHTDRSDEDMPRIEMYRKKHEWLFCVSQYRDSEIVCALKCDEAFRNAEIYTSPETFRFAIDNATMLLFAFATGSRQTLLFHASVVVRQEKACLFLGHSGTGKSTHSRQWLETFPDAVLLNDDNPVVRAFGNEIRVYGSPWSGKTPCYKQMNAPVAAFVQLEQAPVNSVQPMRMTQAYPYLLASVSGLKVEQKMMDQIYETLVALLENKPVYYLKCLPDHDAARLCAQTCLS